jgi:dienelactone hydrolase
MSQSFEIYPLMKHHAPLFIFTIGLLAETLASAQGLSLYSSVSQEAREVTGASLAQPLSPETWKATLAERREKWLEMLGLSPLPKRTPLQATVTGVLERGDYVVEKIHFQSLPGAHVAGNLYRPAKITGKLPAVLYLCGHTKGKVNAPYQANPRWFAQHGYVALVLDPVQLGECQGMHHGTYREGRFDWPSRGYTPAGTEVWNAMRALDYLQSRDDVDGDKMGVTGLSGGGAMSWFLGAADERVKVVVPVCQSGSIERMAVDRATDGHCDCAFWVNYHRWCWSDIGALIAPRAFLIASGSEDVLWRPAGYRDVAHRIRHQYTTLGEPTKFELTEDLAPHGYTPKLRQAIFTFFNTHLKGDPTQVQDDVTDFIEPEENLLVFGGKLPKDDTMMQMDARLVKNADVSLPDSETQWQSHQKDALTKLRQTTFRNIPSDPTPRLRDKLADGGTKDGTFYGTRVFDTTDGLTLAVKTQHAPQNLGPVVVFAMQPDARSTFTGGRASKPASRPSSPALAWKCATLELPPSAPDTCGPCGACIRCSATPCPSARFRICSPEPRSCARNPPPAPRCCSVRAKLPHSPSTPRFLIQRSANSSSTLLPKPTPSPRPPSSSASCASAICRKTLRCFTRARSASSARCLPLTNGRSKSMKSSELVIAFA